MLLIESEEVYFVIDELMMFLNQFTISFYMFFLYNLKRIGVTNSYKLPKYLLIVINKLPKYF